MAVTISASGGFQQSGLKMMSTEGSQHIILECKGTDRQNATELKDAYNKAKTMSPIISNRITIICPPANYNFSGETFVMDTDYIDIVSLDGNSSIIFNAQLDTRIPVLGSISITANNAYVNGVSVQSKQFNIGDNIRDLVLHNCIGGNQSFGDRVIASGTFKNCVAGSNSFANASIASGKFINCTAGENSFGFGGEISGEIISCRLTKGTYEKKLTGIIRFSLDGTNQIINLGE